MTTGIRMSSLPLFMLLPASAGLCTAQVHAAETSQDQQVLQEVVVTATKRSERLQDVPISVSAVTGEDIRARGFTNYADYLNTVPGVFYQEGGPGRAQIHIRGISASEGGVPSTTATYFGETVTSLLTNFGGKPNLRLVDIDRVEVLRGPQGTLFGASALAGVVRIIPNAPNLQSFSADVGMRGYTTAHSEEPSYHIESMVNIPLLRDRVALRLVGYQDDVAGYIDNRFAGRPAVDYGGRLQTPVPDGLLVSPAVPAFERRDINSEDTWGLRAALTWQVNDQLKVDVMHAVQDVTLNSEPHAAPSAGRYRQARSMDFFEQGKQGERLTVDTLTINYDWDSVSLLSATSWSEMQRFANQDITFIAAALFDTELPWILRDRSTGDLFSQEVRLQSRGDGPLQWLLGLYYLKQDAYFSQLNPDYSCPRCLPELRAGQNFVGRAPWAKFSEEDQRSAFATVSYDLTDQWSIGVGARYLVDELTSFSPVSEGFLYERTTAARPPDSTTVREFNPSTYVRFKPSEAMTLYLQAARGFRGGQVNQVAPDECSVEKARRGIGTFTDPDTLWNYELGWKSQLADGRVGLNGAIYRQKWHGVQLLAQLECGFSNGINGGNVTNDGAEVELQVRATEDWLFNLSLAANKSEFDRTETGVGFEPGERVPEVPEVNGSLGAQYNFLLGSEWSSFVRADYMYVGDVRLKFENIVSQQDAFGSANLRVAFRREALSVELFGRNLGDERGVLSTEPPAYGSLQTLTRPRELGVELQYSFD